MRILEKLLLLVLVLLLIAGGAGLIALCFMPQAAVLYYAQWLLNDLFYYRWLTLIVGGTLALLAILVFFGVVCARTAKPAEKRAAAVVKVGDANSNVQITTAAVDCIIQQQKQSFAALSAIESKIVDGELGAQVMLKITARADANMQQLASALQEAVKTQLQEMVGMQVASVKVTIADVIGSTPA